MKTTRKTPELIWNGWVNKKNLFQFIQQLAQSPPRHNRTTLALTSRGGDMDIALAFHQLIMALDLRLTVVAQSHLYSAGVFLFACGRRRLMMPNATLNFHEIFYPIPEANPPLSKIEKAYNETSVAHYAYVTLIAKISNGKLSNDDVAEMMKSEMRLTAKEALKLGLAHKIISP